MLEVEKDSRGRDGYTIYEITRNFWVFEVINGTSFTGSLQEVIVFAMLQHDFNMEELENAVESMAANNHNAANFGMWATFLYSFDKQFHKQLAS